MPISHATAVFLLLALPVAACTAGDGDGAASESLSVHAYATSVTEIMTRVGSEGNYPIGGSTVNTALNFLAIGENLADLKAVRVPGAIRAEHSEVVARAEAVQSEVARYLQRYGVQGDDISMTDISFDADINPLILEAQAACVELGAKLDELGATWHLGMCVV
ncbi:MAG: hypothetical protein O6705_09350 [Actinobacteria bacterium]|nr:hypothetical protein [Actinomycetota bacterium]